MQTSLPLKVVVCPYRDYMTYRERDILVEIRIPKVDVPVAV